MTGSGNVLRIARTTPAAGPLCASVAVLVALGILLFAGSARAASAAESAPEVSSAPAAESAPESSPPLAAESAPAASAPAPESAPEPSSPVVPVVETAKEALAPGETVVESAPEVPVLATVVEAAPETLPPLESAKEVKEGPVAEAIKEAIQVNVTAGQDAAPANNPAAAVGPEVSSAPDGPLATISPVVSGESQAPSTTGSADVAALARRMIAVQRAENFDRALGGLGSSLTGTAGGLDGPSLLSASAVLVDDLSGEPTSSTVAPAGGRSGGSPGGSSPIGPPPGPAPNGTFGGAAGGGTGIALSGFPTFAGYLLRGAPVAMRRLRLSFQPWLTAFFVLIPERPG
jgi:pyruvate dehydrogenase E2 component (dihydrolipoamide acetyltransferase)